MAAPIFGLLRTLNSTFRSKKSEILYKRCVLRFYSCSPVNLEQNINETKNESNSSSDSDGEVDPRNLQLKLLNEALKYVPEYGWNKEAIVAGAKSLGLPGVSHGMISKGGADLVLHFNDSCNQKLEHILKEKDAPSSSQEISNAYLLEAMKTRLEMVIPYVSKWPEAMALMVLPQNVLSDTHHLMDLIDTIWYYAGDKNVYMKWYTRRLSLAGVYKLSELYLCKDSSEDYSSTWQFLEERIEMVIDADNTFSEAQENINFLKTISEGALITARNLIGANRRSYWSK